MLKKWETLPDYMKNDEVRVYYDSLYFIDRKELQLMENISRFINSEQWLAMQIRLVLL